MSFIRAHKIEICIFALALVARLFYFGLALNAHDGDFLATSRAADGYFTISQNVLSGNGFSSDVVAPFTQSSFRVPMQPYFLALSAGLVGSYWLPLILTILMGCLVPLFAMQFASYLSSSRIVVLGTGIFLALEPFSILSSILFYSEPLFMLFLFVSLYYLFNYFRYKKFLHLLFSSAFLGFATLTRPVSEYLPLIIAVILVWEARACLTKEVWLKIGAYLLVFLVVLSPWLIRNKTQFGVFALTPQAGVNLYANLLPSVLSVENGTSFDVEYNAMHAKGISEPNKTNVDGVRGYSSQAIGLLLEHKTAFALTAGTVEISFFTHDGMLNVLKLVGVIPDSLLGEPALFLLLHDPLKLLWFIGHYFSSPIILVLFMRAVWIIVTLCFFVGAVCFVKKKGMTPYAATMLAIIFYIALVTIVVGLSINARLRLPVEALIVPFAWYGFTSIIHSIKNHYHLLRLPHA